MRKIDACDLSRLITDTFDRKFNVPYFMEGQRKITAEVEKSDEDDLAAVSNWLAGGESDGSAFQGLLNALCDKNLLKEDDYLISFDD